jgi:hypothetical protein
MRQTKLDTDERLKFGDELAEQLKHSLAIDDQSGKMLSACSVT